MAHAIIWKSCFPSSGQAVFGRRAEQCVGGINPHAVDHAISSRQDRLDAELSAANHINVLASGKAKTFPKTSKKMLDAER